MVPTDADSAAVAAEDEIGAAVSKAVNVLESLDPLDELETLESVGLGGGGSN